MKFNCFQFFLWWLDRKNRASSKIARSRNEASGIRKMHNLDNTWLIASPICWQATHCDAMLVACGTELQLSEEAGLAWFAAFHELSTMWGFETKYHNASTWLIKPNGAPPIDAPPVSDLYQKPMSVAIRALDKTLYWQRLLTETQLFFTSHPLNATHRGCHTINGIWFWG